MATTVQRTTPSMAMGSRTVVVAIAVGHWRVGAAEALSETVASLALLLILVEGCSVLVWEARVFMDRARFLKLNRYVWSMRLGSRVDRPFKKGTINKQQRGHTRNAFDYAP